MKKPSGLVVLVFWVIFGSSLQLQAADYYWREVPADNIAAGMDRPAGSLMTEDLFALPLPKPKEEKEDAFVRKVREAVEQNLTDSNFNVEKLCKLVFRSHSQLHRKLDALTGCSPNKFIRMIRLKEAKELLQNPDNSVGAVALDCGYADPGYFARVFKQEFGVTPQEWRGKILFCRLNFLTSLSNLLTGLFSSTIRSAKPGSL